MRLSVQRGGGSQAQLRHVSEKALLRHCSHGQSISIEHLTELVFTGIMKKKAKGEIQSLYMADGHFAGEVSIIEEDKNTLTEAQEEAYVRELRDTLKLFEGKVRELSPSSLRGLLDISNIETLMNQILMRIKSLI